MNFGSAAVGGGSAVAGSPLIVGAGAGRGGGTVVRGLACLLATLTLRQSSRPPIGSPDL
ncbi:hypothetical protein FHR90_003079 [Endobacter medicaginis]|uniref:Uncharacterized protein n=1 Tax=Endobacter medicaginis TaxID=1181271 RepID=A0A839V2Y1_9PROT|nr:hypothetical protein [Endobacter medicaginis]MBB3175225.1 hypothetical protein [Endobacter medicaginis]NVN28986.1 hypothetical protein [Endobacter medicaginis]